MIALLQRVSHADVHVGNKQVAEIQQGLLVLVVLVYIGGRTVFQQLSFLTQGLLIQQIQLD